MPNNETLSSPNQSYQLTLKRAFLALFIMLASPIVVGLVFSYGNNFINDAADGSGIVDGQVLAMLSVLVGNVITLIWVWTDIRRFGPIFSSQIGLVPSVIKNKQAFLLLFLLLIATHVFAWIYRSVLLPLVDHGGIIGGASQMFAHLRDIDSAYGLAGFIFLALIVGPMVEEFIFRGYLQSTLARRLPKWGAILITSLLFMVGHGPMILWPMYLIYSIAWGWIFAYTKSLKMAIAIHILSNLFYTVVSVMEWKILA